MVRRDIVRRWLLLLLPIIMIFMQGLYRNVQCAIAVVFASVLIWNFKISIKQSIGVLLLIAGLIISDIFVGHSINFLYEGLKIALLFAGISVSKSEDKKTLISGFYIGISIASFIGIVVYIFGIDGYELINSIDGSRVLQGAFGYANTMALFSGIGIILSVHYRSLNKDYKFIHEFILIINTIALLLTKSLFGFVTLILATLVTLFIRVKKSRKYILISAGAVAIVVFGIFLTGNEEILLRSTVASRLIYWQDSLKVIIKNPFGIGVHNWESIQYGVQTADYSVKYVHNGFIQLLLDGGILAFTGLTLLIVYGYIGLIKKYKEKKSALPLYLITILTFIVAHSFVDINFAYGIVWFLLGLILSLSRTEKVMKSKLVLPIILIAVALIAVIVPEKEYVNPYPIEYQQAYEKNDLEKMNRISAEWIENEPRQQATYDARYYVLDKLKDNKGLIELQSLKEEVNKTMNGLCKYLTRHKEIVLPEVIKE